MYVFSSDDFIEVQIDMTRVKDDELFPASMFEAPDNEPDETSDVEVYFYICIIYLTATWINLGPIDTCRLTVFSWLCFPFNELSHLVWLDLYLFSQNV